jgi:hypothetical protein
MICVFKLSLGSEVKLRKTACQKPDTLSRMPNALFREGSVGVPPALLCGQDARAPLAQHCEGSVGVPPASLCGQDARAPLAQHCEGSVGVPPASLCGQDARAPFSASEAAET